MCIQAIVGLQSSNSKIHIHTCRVRSVIGPYTHTHGHALIWLTHTIHNVYYIFTPNSPRASITLFNATENAYMHTNDIYLYILPACTYCTQCKPTMTHIRVPYSPTPHIMQSKNTVDTSYTHKIVIVTFHRQSSVNSKGECCSV